MTPYREHIPYSKEPVYVLIDLPSGLKGEARKLRGTEAIQLAEKANGSGSSFGSIMKGCWIRTTASGPYTHAEAGSAAINWDKVLKGDLLAALITLRAASIPSPGSPDPVWPGARYDFYVQCGACKKRYGWTVLDIVKDQPRRNLSEESTRKLLAGEPFVAEALDAAGAPHKLTFDLMLPEQDDVLRTLMKQLNQQQDVSRKRVTSVESLAAQTRTIDDQARGPLARQRFFADLDLGELNRLRDLYDSVDCGVDIDVMTTCQDPDCGWEQETMLPFGRTFWKPEAVKKQPELSQ